jgi:hypothetical protein
MPLHALSESDLREHCKRAIEALEMWLRRLIDDQLSRAYGSNYIDSRHADGSRVIRSALAESLIKRQRHEPKRFARPIDSALLEDEIAIICNPVLYKKHFKVALDSVFPHGNEMARTIMQRLVMPRNALYHANPISLHDAYRILCYTVDVIEGLKHFYADLNVSELFNVPMVIRVVDSLGHAISLSGDRGSIAVDYSNDPSAYLRCGDTLSIEVDVDPTFSPEEYEIRWLISNVGGPAMTGRKLKLLLTERYVSSRFCAVCQVTSRRSWHKLGMHDDQIDIAYKVLPPP